MTVVASANILYTLPPRAAADALDAVLAEAPDLVSLQEWYLPRLGLLRVPATSGSRPSGGLPAIPVPAPAPRTYHWVATVPTATSSAAGRTGTTSATPGRS